MAGIAAQVGLWVGKNVLDDFLQTIKERSLDLETTKQALLLLIENPDKNAIWGIMKTYDDEFKKFDDTLRKSKFPLMTKNEGTWFTKAIGLQKPLDYVHNWTTRAFETFYIHFFWELLMGRKFFEPLYYHCRPNIHPEAKALVHVHLMIFLTAIFHPDRHQYCEDLVQTHLAPELKLEEDYVYGHFWTVQVCYGTPKKFSVYDNLIGKLWDGADIKWYQSVKQMYKRLVLDRATKVSTLTDEELSYIKVLLWKHPGYQKIDDGERWWNRYPPE